MKVTGFPTSLARKSCVFSGAAEAKTSAGAPFLICVSSAFEPAKLYRCAGSNAVNASVSDEAA